MRFSTLILNELQGTIGPEDNHCMHSKYVERFPNASVLSSFLKYLEGRVLVDSTVPKRSHSWRSSITPSSNCAQANILSQTLPKRQVDSLATDLHKTRFLGVQHSTCTWCGGSDEIYELLNSLLIFCSHRPSFCGNQFSNSLLRV